jgi:hypothetical protein
LGHLLGTGLLELFVEHAEAPQSASSLSLDARLVRASGTGLHHQLDANGCVRTSTPYAKLVRQAGTIYFDGGERRPLVESYGVDLDCVKAGQRRLLALTDLGFATDFTPEELSSLIEASVELAKEPLTLQQLGVKLAREHPGRPIAEIVRILDQLCRTPFRVLSMIDI